MNFLGYNKSYGRLGDRYIDPSSSLNRNEYNQYKQQMLDMLTQNQYTQARQFAGSGRQMPWQESNNMQANAYEGMNKGWNSILGKNQQLGMEYKKMQQMEENNYRSSIGSLIGTGVGGLTSLGMNGLFKSGGNWLDKLLKQYQWKNKVSGNDSFNMNLDGNSYMNNMG